MIPIHVIAKDRFSHNKNIASHVSSDEKDTMYKWLLNNKNPLSPYGENTKWDHVIQASVLTVIEHPFKHSQ